MGGLPISFSRAGAFISAAWIAAVKIARRQRKKHRRSGAHRHERDRNLLDLRFFELDVLARHRVILLQ